MADIFEGGFPCQTPFWKGTTKQKAIFLNFGWNADSGEFIGKVYIKDNRHTSIKIVHMPLGSGELKTRILSTKKSNSRKCFYKD